MARDHDAVQAGVAEAWSGWLGQHDVSAVAAIHLATREAVEDWLNRRGEGLITEAVAEVVRLLAGASDEHSPADTSSDA